jgi:exopolysaccharide production protein ExoQ
VRRKNELVSSPQWSVVVAVIVVAVGFIALMPPRAVNGLYSILEVSLALLAVVSVVSLVAARAQRAAWAGIPTSIAALLLVMLASTLWSVESWTTARDAVAYCILALVAWCLVSACGLRVIVLGVVAGGMTVLALSLLALAVDPASALYYESTGFQGIFDNRNTLGYVMVQALPAALALTFSTLAGRFVKWSFVAAFFVATVATLSQTSLVVACVTLFVWSTMMVARRWSRAIIAAGVLVVVAVALALANFSMVLSALGKDLTINGRVLIWEALLGVVPQSPVIGFGWSRSWAPNSAHSIAVSDELGSVLFHAHNEVLNWLVTTGVIGAALAVSVYGFVLWAGACYARFGAEADRLWPLLAGVVIVTRGLTEISETNAQGWFVLMLAAFVTARHLATNTGRAIPWPVMISSRAIPTWGRERFSANRAMDSKIKVNAAIEG